VILEIKLILQIYNTKVSSISFTVLRTSQSASQTNNQPLSLQGQLVRVLPQIGLEIRPEVLLARELEIKAIEL
jgi:hypothetical protein